MLLYPRPYGTGLAKSISFSGPQQILRIIDEIMPTEFKLPNLGEGIKSADVAGISVKEGDTIEPNQNVLELETDKAVVELPCPTGGKVLSK